MVEKRTTKIYIIFLLSFFSIGSSFGRASEYNEVQKVVDKNSTDTHRSGKCKIKSVYSSRELM